MKLAAALLVFSFGAGAAEIPKGTHVLLRMMNSISTRTAAEGNQVYLQTATPVAIDNRIVIPPGTYVQGVGLAFETQRAREGARGAGHTARDHDLRGRQDGEDFAALERGRFGRERAESGRRRESGEGGGHAAEKTRGKWRFSRARARPSAAWRIAASKAPGIGGGVGTAVGLARVLLSRGNEVELRQGTTLDVVFDRDVVIE